MLELSHIDKYYNPGSVNEMCLFQDFNLVRKNICATAKSAEYTRTLLPGRARI